MGAAAVARRRRRPAAPRAAPATPPWTDTTSRLLSVSLLVGSTVWMIVRLSNQVFDNSIRFCSLYHVSISYYLYHPPPPLFIHFFFQSFFFLFVFKRFVCFQEVYRVWLPSFSFLNIFFWFAQVDEPFPCGCSFELAD